MSLLLNGSTAEFRTFSLIERAIDEGISAGWRAAHKHVDDPDELMVHEAMAREIAVALDEIIDFGPHA